MNQMDPRASEARDKTAVQATPVMAQFLEVKAGYPGCLLFYRMGDFYELFFADAEVAARDLGIALTKRGKHLGEDIPMCGVPVHAADNYLQRLIRLGHRVAVCEQMEDPSEARKRGAKSVVRRGVVRLVTPGTLTEDTLLDSRSSNYLAGLARVKASGELALAWADISSGDLAAMSSHPGRLAADLARLAAREIVVADSLLLDPAISQALTECGAALTPLPASRFDSTTGERRLKEHFSVSALEAFGNFSRAEIASLGGLLDYILITQVGRLPHLRAPRREEPSGALLIDMATRMNLELTRTLAGEKAGSLLSAIDLTVTASGARALARRLANPLAEPEAIANRLDEVAYFHNSAAMRAKVRECLANMPDIERSLGRLTVGRGGPRDLSTIRTGLSCAWDLGDQLAAGNGLAGIPANVESWRTAIGETDRDLIECLTLALADDLPVFARDGGFVSTGYLPELDHNRLLRDQTRQVIAELQVKYAEEAGIKGLKIRHNNFLGYFIEVAAQNASALQAPSHAATFIHRQTVANAMRFVTAELAGLEQRIAAAADRALALELEIFEKLVNQVTTQSPAISRIAEAIAGIDVAASLAELAERQHYVRPRIDNSLTFDIRAGRHPVVEAMLAKFASGSFVPNDCRLIEDSSRIWLLTGPNMAGKSTFLRQNALIVIMAQMGSYVPAERAHIGIVDRLFSRVGAADDLARGRSTFMVEMVETAAILNQATARSFVILDEIGRGTATYDGLSIAWAVIEQLHDGNRCRALFATHYHELTALSDRLPLLSNATVKAREWQGEVIFLHEVVPGVADRSYGIQVARLAGLLQPVVSRATEILEKLERGETSANLKSAFEDLPLFSVSRPTGRDLKRSSQSQIEKRMASISPDELSPRQALDLIYELRALLPGNS